MQSLETLEAIRTKDFLSNTKRHNRVAKNAFRLSATVAVLDFLHGTQWANGNVWVRSAEFAGTVMLGSMASWPETIPTKANGLLIENVTPSPIYCKTETKAPSLSLKSRLRIPAIYATSAIGLAPGFDMMRRTLVGDLGSSSATIGMVGLVLGMGSLCAAGELQHYRQPAAAVDA
jgi:hypothetical protein